MCNIGAFFVTDDEKLEVVHYPGYGSHAQQCQKYSGYSQDEDNVWKYEINFHNATIDPDGYPYVVSPWVETHTTSEQASAIALQWFKKNWGSQDAIINYLTTMDLQPTLERWSCGDYLKHMLWMFKPRLYNQYVNSFDRCGSGHTEENIDPMMSILIMLSLDIENFNSAWRKLFKSHGR